MQRAGMLFRDEGRVLLSIKQQHTNLQANDF